MRRATFAHLACAVVVGAVVVGAVATSNEGQAAPHHPARRWSIRHGVRRHGVRRHDFPRHGRTFRARRATDNKKRSPIREAQTLLHKPPFYGVCNLGSISPALVVCQRGESDLCASGGELGRWNRCLPVIGLGLAKTRLGQDAVGPGRGWARVRRARVESPWRSQRKLALEGYS